MPRGRSRGGAGHKGQRRHFSNPDQLEENKEKKERERQWRQQRGELSSDEEGEKNSSSGSSSSEEEEEEAGDGEVVNDEEAKTKGVQHLIDVENPNRIVKKEKKVATLAATNSNEDQPQPQLSRREREEIEKQKAKAHYQKMHAAGRTAEARADLARLAIIRQQRDDAAKKRELELQAKKDADTAKLEQTKRALGKKT